MIHLDPNRCYQCNCVLGDGFESDYCMNAEQALKLYAHNQVYLLWLLAEAEYRLAECLSGRPLWVPKEERPPNVKNAPASEFFTHCDEV